LEKKKEALKRKEKRAPQKNKNNVSQRGHSSKKDPRREKKKGVRSLKNRTHESGKGKKSNRL